MIITIQNGHCLGEPQGFNEPGFVNPGLTFSFLGEAMKSGQHSLWVFQVVGLQIFGKLLKFIQGLSMFIHHIPIFGWFNHVQPSLLA